MERGGEGGEYKIGLHACMMGSLLAGAASRGRSSTDRVRASRTRRTIEDQDVNGGDLVPGGCVRERLVPACEGSALELLLNSKGVLERTPRGKSTVEASACIWCGFALQVRMRESAHGKPCTVRAVPLYYVN